MDHSLFPRKYFDNHYHDQICCQNYIYLVINPKQTGKDGGDGDSDGSSKNDNSSGKNPHK